MNVIIVKCVHLSALFTGVVKKKILPYVSHCIFPRQYFDLIY